MQTRSDPPSRSFLFVTFEGGGNVAPVLGVARRLCARGHRVAVLAEPCLRAAVEAAGASFRPFTRHFVRTDRSRDLIGDAQASTPVGALDLAFRRVVFGPWPERHGRPCARWRPTWSWPTT